MLVLIFFTKPGPAEALGRGGSGALELGRTFGATPSADLAWSWTPETQRRGEGVKDAKAVES